MAGDLMPWERGQLARQTSRELVNLERQAMRELANRRMALAEARDRIAGGIALGRYAAPELAAFDEIIEGLVNHRPYLEDALRGLEDGVVMGVASRIFRYLQ